MEAAMRLLIAAMLALAFILTPSPAAAQEERCQADVAQGQQYAPWAGPWAKHGAGTNVRADGCGVMSWRTYEPCRFGVYDGVCDPVINGEIGHGGKAVFMLTVRTGAAASGRMLARTAAGSPPNFGIVLTLQADGTLGVEWDGQGQTFCRTWDWRPRCGA